MNIEKIKQKYLKQGYTNANATAKVCQDIILKKISESIYLKNVTIKGGVVMHSISNDKRRATRDVDIDFIKYSLDTNAIIRFIEKLNNNCDGIFIKMDGIPEKLHHQDYDGKRVNVIIKDSYNNVISTKLDIGIHKNMDIMQEEYCFELKEINTVATLFINSPEQIILEKVKSLLKFGILTTRYKDIFDIYYLVNNMNINKEKFNKYIFEIIYTEKNSKEKNIEDVINKLEKIFYNKVFVNNLKKVKNNWIDIPIENILKNILNFFNSLDKGECNLG